MKRVIDVSETLYNACKRFVSEGDPRPSESCIAYSEPYEPSESKGDLISREALIREIGRTDEWYKGRSICNIIDNAQTVEITEEQAINKLHETGWLIGHDKEMTTRPQGEWKTNEGYDGDEYYECSNCGEPWFFSAGTPKDNNMNFCPNCGADMRGGAE